MLQPVKRLDPRNPDDRPLIARNVTAAGIAACVVALLICLAIAIFHQSIIIRIAGWLGAAVAAISIVYYAWLRRAVAKNPEVARQLRWPKLEKR